MRDRHQLIDSLLCFLVVHRGLSYDIWHEPDGDTVAGGPASETPTRRSLRRAVPASRVQGRRGCGVEPSTNGGFRVGHDRHAQYTSRNILALLSLPYT